MLKLEKTNFKIIDINKSNKEILIEDNIKLNNQILIDKYYLEKIMPKINKISKKIIEDEDEDPSKIKSLYDELKKLRLFFLNNYEKNMSKKAVDYYMKNIRFLALELRGREKIKYNEKTSSRRR